MLLNQELIVEIQSLNPWLLNQQLPDFPLNDYFPRSQESYLLDSEWDNYWILLAGPRQTGKTTLAQLLKF